MISFYSFAASHLHRLNKKIPAKKNNKTTKNPQVLTNLSRTGRLGCSFNFNKLSKAILPLKSYFVTLKLAEVYIEFFIGSCSMHSGKWKITVQKTRKDEEAEQRTHTQSINFWLTTHCFQVERQRLKNDIHTLTQTIFIF
jgi:hypothetical protein